MMKTLPLLLLLCACETPPLGTPTATATAIDTIELDRSNPGDLFSCIPNTEVDIANFDVERDLRVLIDISGSNEATSCDDIKVTSAGQSGAQIGDSVAEAFNGNNTLCVVRRDPNDGFVFLKLEPQPGVCISGQFETVDFQFPDLTTITFEYVTLLQ
jgi:hypothetical protein